MNLLFVSTLILLAKKKQTNGIVTNENFYKLSPGWQAETENFHKFVLEIARPEEEQK